MDRLPLLHELAANGEPIERTVFPRLKGEPDERGGTDEPDEPRARHNPYRWRPG